MDLAQSIALVVLSEPVTAIQPWIRLITWETQGGERKKFPLGFGSDDFWNVSTKRLNAINPPEDRTKPRNPFVSLQINRVPPVDYPVITGELKEIIEETIELVMIGRNLYCELTQILRNNNFQVENTVIALEKLNFEAFRRRLVPYVTSNAETLNRLKLLSAAQWAQYQKFRRLLASFKETVLDESVAYPYNAAFRIFPNEEHFIQRNWPRIPIAKPEIATAIEE